MELKSLFERIVCPMSAFGELFLSLIYVFFPDLATIWDDSKVGIKITRYSVVNHFATFLWTSSMRFLILINNLLIFWLIRCLLSLFLRPFNPVLALISLSICCPNRKILVISRLPISINFSPSNPVKKLRTPGSNAMMD